MAMILDESAVAVVLWEGGNHVADIVVTAATEAREAWAVAQRLQ